MWNDRTAASKVRSTLVYKKSFKSMCLWLCLNYLYSLTVYVSILTQMIVSTAQDTPDVRTLDVIKTTDSLHAQESVQRESSSFILSETSLWEVFPNDLVRFRTPHNVLSFPHLTSMLPSSPAYREHTGGPFTDPSYSTSVYWHNLYDLLSWLLGQIKYGLSSWRGMQVRACDFANTWEPPMRDNVMQGND